MSCRSTMSLITAFVVVLSFTAQYAEAGFTFFAPTPYLSAADSPFAAHLSSPNFYLEDFEDGELNTPGIFQPLHPATHAEIVGPSLFTDSVDGDSGIIDGSGNSGHSLTSRFFIFQPTLPQINFSKIRLAFDETVLGWFPNTLGFALTDAQQDSGLRVQAFRQGELLEEIDIADGLGDGQFDGGTQEDVFVALRTTEGIDFVEITSIYFGEPSGFEIDHIQYGFLVPEPSTYLLLIICFTRVLFSRQAGRR